MHELRGTMLAPKLTCGGMDGRTTLYKGPLILNSPLGIENGYGKHEPAMSEMTVKLADATTVTAE